MGFLGFGKNESHQLTDDHLVKFWRYVGNATFDRFRMECINNALRNVMFPNEEISFNDALLSKWRAFEEIEGLKKQTLNQLIVASEKEWPIPLTTNSRGLYREILKLDGVRKAEEVLKLAKSIDADGNLDGIKTQLQMLSSIMDGPSSVELYVCLCESGVYDGLWRKQYVTFFPQSEAYLPPCCASEAEFKHRQLAAKKDLLLDLPRVKGNSFYENLIKNIITTNEKLNARTYDHVSFTVEPPAKEQDIREHEKEIGAEIPAQLREVLLSVSGYFEFHWRVKEERRQLGAYDSGWVEWKLRDIKTVCPSDYGIDDEDLDEYDWINALHVFSFGSGDFVAIGLDGEHAGKVYYYDHGEFSFTHIADNFNEFLQESAQRDFCDLEMVLLYFGIEKKSFTFDSVPKNQLSVP